MGIGKGDDRVWRYNSDQSEVPEQPSGGTAENCFTIMGMAEGKENCEEELASPLYENMESLVQLYPGRLKEKKSHIFISYFLHRNYKFIPIPKQPEI